MNVKIKEQIESRAKYINKLIVMEKLTKNQYNRLEQYESVYGPLTAYQIAERFGIDFND